ncbi:MAG: hypothetical protein ACLTLY_07605 [Agathobacter rectalis]
MINDNDMSIAAENLWRGLYQSLALLRKTDGQADAICSRLWDLTMCVLCRQGATMLQLL